MKMRVPTLTVLALTACSRDPEEPRVAVADAVVTVPAVPGGAGAAYFTLTTTNDPSRLVSITSPSAQSIELHVSRQESGRSQMVPLPPAEATFTPAQPLRFTPGGRHAMLMGMDDAVLPGGKMTLTFQVEPVGPVTVEAEVRAPGQAHAEH